MKKSILLFLFISISNLGFSQSNVKMGVSTYVYPGSVGFRWAKFMQYSSDGAAFNKMSFEFRTAFAASFAGEGNVVMVQPELNAVFNIRHDSNASFMSGIGMAFGYQNENDNFLGAYIPLVTEFCPNFSARALSIKVEGDVFYKKYPNFSSVNFRPLVGVVYNFSRKAKSYNANQ